MTKTEVNNRIVAEARIKIAEAGLEQGLDIYPVTNTFTRRPRYWNDGNISYFKVQMWDLNKLSEEDISKELDLRISAARAHFGM